jgi:hypothetical protein
MVASTQIFMGLVTLSLARTSMAADPSGTSAGVGTSSVQAARKSSRAGIKKNFSVFMVFVFGARPCGPQTSF